MKKMHTGVPVHSFLAHLSMELDPRSFIDNILKFRNFCAKVTKFKYSNQLCALNEN